MKLDELCIANGQQLTAHADTQLLRSLSHRDLAILKPIMKMSSFLISLTTNYTCALELHRAPAVYNGEFDIVENS